MNKLAKVFSMEEILSGIEPRKDKIIKASQELSGLEITQLGPSVKKKLNTYLIKLNSILSQYNIKAFDDYSQISDSHLDKMIDTLKKVCSILKKNF
jgi:hypothetical protein